LHFSRHSFWYFLPPLYFQYLSSLWYWCDYLQLKTFTPIFASLFSFWLGRFPFPCIAFLLRGTYALYKPHVRWPYVPPPSKPPKVRLTNEAAETPQRGIQKPVFPFFPPPRPHPPTIRIFLDESSTCLYLLGHLPLEPLQVPEAVIHFKPNCLPLPFSPFSYFKDLFLPTSHSLFTDPWSAQGHKFSGVPLEPVYQVAGFYFPPHFTLLPPLSVSFHQQRKVSQNTEAFPMSHIPNPSTLLLFRLKDLFWPLFGPWFFPPHPGHDGLTLRWAFNVFKVKTLFTSPCMFSPST